MDEKQEADIQEAAKQEVTALRRLQSLFNSIRNSVLEHDSDEGKRVRQVYTFTKLLSLVVIAVVTVGTTLYYSGLLPILSKIVIGNVLSLAFALPGLAISLLHSKNVLESQKDRRKLLAATKFDICQIDSYARRFVWALSACVLLGFASLALFSCAMIFGGIGLVVQTIAYLTFFTTSLLVTLLDVRSQVVFLVSFNIHNQTLLTSMLNNIDPWIENRLEILAKEITATRNEH